MAERTPLHARYGISTFESFFDIDSRRHLMPSVMDYVPHLAKRCACPGGKNGNGNLFIQCIEPYTQPDYLCDACREHCLGADSSGKMVRFIDHFGPAYHIVKARNVGPIVIESELDMSEPDTSVSIPLPLPPMVQPPYVPAGDPPPPPAVAAPETLQVPREASSNGIIWALAPNGKRVHAYRNRRGLYPRSLCSQSQMKTWEEVKERTSTSVPECGTCLRLIGNL